MREGKHWIVARFTMEYPPQSTVSQLLIINFRAVLTGRVVRNFLIPRVMPWAVEELPLRARWAIVNVECCKRHSIRGITSAKPDENPWNPLHDQNAMSIVL